jgi:hypothetical protein
MNSSAPIWNWGDELPSLSSHALIEAQSSASNGRIHISACEPCRKRKQKCFETRPCARCIARGCEDLCIKSSIVKAKTNSKRESKLLEPRKMRSRRRTLLGDVEVALIPFETANFKDVLTSNSPLSKKMIDFFQLAKWNLVNLGAFSLKQNYFTSLWIEPLPNEILDIANSFPDRYTGAQFADFLLRQPLSWKWFLHALEFAFDSKTTKYVQHKIIKKALEDPDVDELSREMLVALKDFPGLNQLSLVYMKVSEVVMSEEESEIVRTLFNVHNIEGSDIAMVQVREFFDMETMSFKVLIEMNEEFERVLELPLKDYVEIVHAGRGLFSVGPRYWVYDKGFWPEMTELWLGSIFRDPVFITDIVNVMTVEGKKVPSLLHSFVSYDSEYGVRTALTVCLKPLSPTFMPNLANRST